MRLNQIIQGFFRSFFRRFFQPLFGPVLDFLFPPTGTVHELEKVLESASESGATDSESGFTAGAAALTRILPASEPVEVGAIGSLTTPPADIVTLFVYSDEKVKHLVWEIKYYRNEKIIDAVGSLLAAKILELCGGYGKGGAGGTGRDLPVEFFLVPIPLTRRRIVERGFNHTELLARAILKNLPTSHFHLATDFLKKVRHTPKQSSIENREERFQNMTGAFQVLEQSKVAGLNIIVIDDVITTGATVAEASRALAAAGAKNVWVFAVAH